VLVDGPDEDYLQAVYAAADDSRLDTSLRMATDNRIARHILTPVGLYAVRWFAAQMVVQPDDENGREPVTPIEALGAFLDAIFARIADRPGEWLNSLALIGRRLVGDQYGGWTPQTGLYTSQGKEAALADLVAADGAKALAPRLRRDVAGFHRFVQQMASKHTVDGVHCAAYVEDAILGLLLRGTIDGKAVGSIRYWRYFEPAIAEQMARLTAEARNRPAGDPF
jgi:hypothetical protein